MKTRIRRNVLLFKLNSFFADMWPLSALAIVYFAEITGSYASAMGVFAVANLVTTCAEVPLGILSDKTSRKNTIIAFSVVSLLSFIAFALAGNLTNVWLLFFGGALWGISDALRSGTYDAMIYETMEQLRKEHKFDILYAAARAYAQAGLAVGAVTAMIVTYFYSLNILAWVAIVPPVFQTIVAMFFVEPNLRTKEDTTSFQHFMDAFKGLMQNRKLQALGAIQMLNKGFGHAAHRLEGVYFNNLVSTWLVNVSRIVKQCAGMISYMVVPYLRHFGFFRLLLISAIGNVAVRTAAVILNNALSPFIMPWVNLFHGTEGTAETALLQKELSKKQRATMGSIVSLFGGILSAMIYWFIGALADWTSVYAAIIFLIAMKGVIGLLYWAMLKKYSTPS